MNVVERLADLSALGRYEGGIDRPLGSPQERAARERFAVWSRAKGYALSQDRVGNLFAQRSGANDAPPILVGSHLDTVKTGGAYDGAYGVVAALCSLELLDDENITTMHPVCAVAWAGEEGSRFPLGCLGSSVFAGVAGADETLALVDEKGVTLGQAMASSDGGLLPGVPMRDDARVSAYLELHIEQGPILERAGASLGIVTAIAGQRRLRAIVQGTSGHAGTVPMDHRADALSAAAELILALESFARTSGNAVATVGRAIVEPNGTNVIPGRVMFSIDIRSPEDSKLDAIERAFDERRREIEAQRNVNIVVEALERRTPTPMHAAIREAVRRAIEGLGQRALDVPSGAGHDAIPLAAIAPSAMLFVPSIGGRSHVAEERTADADLELGVRALTAAIVEVDRGIGKK
jgi:beta-ureidopropionase / N-carbamoyl-L-amino-acid hydrolase